MNKAKILAIINVVFLILFSFIVVSEDEQKPYNEMTRAEQEEFLIELFGEGTTVTPDDVEIVGNMIFINNGYAVLTSETSLPVVLNGGSVNVNEYTSSGQHIEIGERGGIIEGKNGDFNFGSGGVVIVVRGYVRFEDVNLKEGSEIDTIVGGIQWIHGVGISYYSTTKGMMISGRDITIEGFNYVSEKGGDIFYDPKSRRIDTQGDWVFVKNSDRFSSKIKGFAERGDLRNGLFLLGYEGKPSEFENSKGTKVKVFSNTCVGPSCYEVDTFNKAYYLETDKGDDFYVHVKDGSTIEIETNDGDYMNFIIDQKREDSELKLILEKDIFNKGVFYFKEGKQLEQGSIEGFETNIAYKFTKFEPGISSPLYYAITLTPTPILNKLTGNYARGLKALARYLYGSGEPMDIDLSEEEWGDLIEQTENRRWTPSTNPEYHSNDGWEYMGNVDPVLGYEFVYEGTRQPDAWNLLGKTTLRRRKTDEGYHYMIAGETFDFVGSSWEHTTKYRRIVTAPTAKLGKFFFSDMILTDSDSEDSNSEWVILSVNSKWIQEHGKSFPIVGEYIKKD